MAAMPRFPKQDQFYAAELILVLDAVRGGDGQWIARCPAHDDHTPSLSITERNGRVFWHCHAGCSQESVAAAIQARLGASAGRKGALGDNANGDANAKTLVATYAYRNADGTVQMYRDRYEWCAHGRRQKAVYPRQLDGRKKGTPSVPYNLPAILEAIRDGAPILFVEGEKCADILTERGYPAVTTTGGSTSWKASYARFFIGARRIILLPDNDQEGESYISRVARTLAPHVELRVVRFAEKRKGWDVADFFADGGTDEQLVERLRAAALYTVGEVSVPAPPVIGERSDAAENGARSESRPDIMIRPELVAMTDAGIAAIANRPDLNVFVRARQLVTIARDGSHRDTWLRRPPGAPVIVPLEHAAILDALDRSAHWWKHDRRKGANGRTAAFPPFAVATQVLARTDWPFRYLEGIVESPTLRTDGSLLTAPGYDEISGLLLLPAPGSGPASKIPLEPTHADVENALETLVAPFSDFPFIADSDRSAAIAAILSIVARPMIHGPVPAFAIRAPTPGTGKGLLAAAIILIGTGREPATASMCDGDEMRKRITSLALTGTGTVLLDNISGAVGSDVLANALTSTTWEDRLLGRSETVRLPLRLTWLMTGNNLRFAKTLGRRVVPIDLDAHVEHPEDRNRFAQPDLLGHIRRHRQTLVAAALTILRGFVVAGRPLHGAARLGSFETWDDVVRSAVVWTSLADPASSDDPGSGRGRVRAQSDDDVEDMAELYHQLYRVFRSDSWTANDAWGRREHDEALRLALDTAAILRRDHTKPATIISFRTLLRATVDRPVRGLILKRASDPNSREQCWVIVRIDDAR